MTSAASTAFNIWMLLKPGSDPYIGEFQSISFKNGYEVAANFLAAESMPSANAGAPKAVIAAAAEAAGMLRCTGGTKVLVCMWYTDTRAIAATTSNIFPLAIVRNAFLQY